MPKTFKKDLIKPGTYYPRGEDGKPFKEVVTLDRIRHWSRETNRLLKNGNRVPMPYVHTDDAVPFLAKDPEPGSYKNGAYLTRTRVRKDGTLEIELKGGTEEDDEKIGNSVKDVSFRSKDQWTDGSGKTYKDVFTHVALVNHPIVTGQENFIPTGGLALSMWMAGEQSPQGAEPVGNPEAESSGNKLDSLLELLSEHGFELPEDTDETNFTDRLWTALTAVKSFKETQQEGDAERLDKPPEGAKRQQPAPLAMATELEFAIETLSSGLDNPATGKPWTAGELTAAHTIVEASKPQLEFSAEQNAQLAAIQIQAKMPLLDRIRKLIGNKTVSPTDAQAELIPLLNETELQFSQEQETLGHVVENTPLHVILAKLEKLSPGAALHNRTDLQDSVNLGGLELSLETGLTTHEHPEDWTEGEGSKDQDKTADRMAGYVGR